MARESRTRDGAARPHVPRSQCRRVSAGARRRDDPLCIEWAVWPSGAAGTSPWSGRPSWPPWGWAGSLKAPGAVDEEFSMPGIESRKAFDLMEQRFPGATADGATARVVFIAPGGEKATAAGNREAVEKAVAGRGGGTRVASAVGPFRARTVGQDGTTAFATVTYKVGAHDLTDAARGPPGADHRAGPGLRADRRGGRHRTGRRGPPLARRHPHPHHPLPDGARLRSRARAPGAPRRPGGPGT
ncbi:MMPL family transporter [Streptomyces luteogriseus]|uniref:MMPL family transporter n=1 Tax=Streptomyces luteogriseus TaxID=68233 RepID=UPI0035E3FB60